MYDRVLPSVEAIDSVRNACAEALDRGTRFRGMTYEQGVEAAIHWLFENVYETPTDE